ncbi:MAG: peptidylprolyl isomerase [Chthoniobacterales bacterium]
MLSARPFIAALVSSLACFAAAASLRAAPVVSAQISDQELYDATPARQIYLNTKFSDPSLPANTVRLTTALGTIDVTLYNQQTPITVDNFLRYVDTGAYLPPDPNFGGIAPVFFHRSVPGFVIQSGGYVATQDPTNPPKIFPSAVATFSPIPNEARPDLHNVRGTIAMAKLATDPDSATSQWFINLADNGGEPNNLDTTNGGFTVFGTVSDAGMATADAIAAVPIYNAAAVYGSAFTELPLRNFSSGLPEKDNFILISGITRPLVFTTSSDNAAVATASVISSSLFVQGLSPGTANITVTATDANGATASQVFAVNVTSTPVRAANISTRLQVGAGDDALIGGFIISGTASKRVIVRAIGPSLAGVPNALANPTLELRDGTGALIASNDQWEFATNKRDIMNSGLVPSDPNESAILTTIPATSSGSAYTAIVRSVTGTAGIGLVEVYDLDAGPGASLLNISTRGNVETGDNVMIGGFIVAGNGSQQVLVRAIGPSLAAQGVANPLSDPTLTLYDAQGTELDFNDNWQDNPAAAEIEATTIPPNDPKEAALLPTLAPGGYTAIVRGAGSATGTGLVEVYVLNPVP